MGGKQSVSAAERKDSIMASLKTLLGPGGDRPSNTDSTSARTSDMSSSPSTGAGDTAGSRITSTEPSLTKGSEDPKSIVSTLPSFPGSWNKLHKVKDLTPATFDGIRATFNKGLNQHFQVSHNFTLGTMERSGYKFGAVYAGTKQLSLTETFPILIGEMDPAGNLTAQCLHAFSRNTRSRLVAQHQDGQFQAIEVGTDYRDPTCTLSLTAANPDLLAQTGIYIGQALYAVRPNLAFGVEGLLQRAMHPSLGRIATRFSGSLMAKYDAKKWSAAIQISPMEKGLHASYYHKIKENQAIGVELEKHANSPDCTTTLAYSVDIPGADCTVKASVDTSMNVSTTIERKLTPLPMTLTLSCQSNQKKSQYLAGIGITTD